MKRLTVILLTLATILTVVLALGSCDQGGKRVTIRYKFQPDMKMLYKQITRGMIMIRDVDQDKLTHSESAETTMNIEYFVRRLLDDSTAEIIDSKTTTSRWTNRLDSTGTDSVETKTKTSPQVVKYIKPNGRLVDMEYASDTAHGSLDYSKEYYKQGFPVFPDGPVGQGHSWTQSTTVVLPDGPMEAQTTYIIKSFARERGYDCVIIEYDGVSIIPLPEYEKEDYLLIAGVDNIRSKGHMYFAYKEGIVVMLKERWLMDSDRTKLIKQADTVMGYQPGDTVQLNIAIEYDVDYYLQGLEMP
jgi:hypothetical protein